MPRRSPALSADHHRGQAEAPTVRPGDPNGPLVNLFVYGTLRRGGRLHHLIQPITVGTIEDVTAPGLALYHVVNPKPGKRPIYPVAEPTRDAIAHGDLVFCQPGRQLFNIFQMELGSGYGLRQVKVGGLRVGSGALLSAPGVKDGVKAWVFTWPGGDRGRRIVGDDWARVPGALPGRNVAP